MLCSIFDGNTAEVLAAPWRRAPDEERPAEAPPPVVVPPAPDSSEEITRLSKRIEETTALAEQRAKEAWEQGVRAGDTAARKSLDEQVKTAVDGLAKTVADVSSTRADAIRRAEADTVQLAIAIARRVLHRELSIDNSALEALIRAALAKLRNQEVYRVRIHPDLEKLMRACLEQTGRGSAVEVIGDPAQSKGGASFEISRGTLDASVDTQLREIEYGLADEMRRRS